MTKGARRFFDVDVDERRCRILMALLKKSLTFSRASPYFSRKQVLFWTTTVLSSGGVAARPEDVCYLARETVSREGEKKEKS